MRNRLKVLRAERNLTQEELAKMSGLSRATVISIENEAVNPNGDTIAKLTKALKVKPEEIFFELNVV